MKDIPGYEGYYAATEDGQIWSYRSNKFLKQTLDPYGYYKVSFSINNQIKTYFVHRLIALTYIPNLENKETVDHIDRNRTNNNISNLRWATSKEQAQNINPDYIEKRKNNFKNHHNNGFSREVLLKAAKKSADINSKAIEMRDKDNHSILYQVFRNAEDAAEELFNDRTKGSSIRRCARGVRNSAYGYYWTFVDKEKSLTPEAGYSSSAEVTNDNTV